VAIAGIDIGTTGCKCTVCNRDGKILAEAYYEYKSSDRTESNTINPLSVWEGVKFVLKLVVEKVKDIKSIAVTSFGESAVLLDENDNAVMDSYLYTDKHGVKEAKFIEEAIGRKNLNKITSLNAGAMYSVPKIMWIKKEKSEPFKKATKILLFQDYIVFMLSGKRQIDYSLATRTMAFDIDKLDWSNEILDIAGIDINLLSQCVPTGTIAGPIKKHLAQELGINSEIIIVSGCHDQMAAALGTGTLNAGSAVDGTGTVECISAVFDGKNKSVNKSKLYPDNYAIVPYGEDKFITYAVSFTGGALLKWYRDKLNKAQSDFLISVGNNPYEHFNKTMDAVSPTGILILPHFAGAGTPYMNPESVGAIIGLSTQTSAEDIYKALMEGVTYEMRLNIELFEKAGVIIDTIKATGGGAASSQWLQIKADILKKPIVSLGAAQSGTLGCIMLAGVACGEYKNLDEAAKILVKEKEVFYPRELQSKQYDKLFKKYRKLYSAVQQVIMEE